MFAFQVDGEIRLGLLEPHHAEPLWQLVEKNLEHLDPWMPWARESSLDSIRLFIEGAMQQFGRRDGFQTGIWYRQTLAGVVGLRYLDHGVGTTEIGYWLSRELQGKGIVTRVVAGLCRLLFEEVGLQRIEIRCDPGNARSRAIPERLGFRQEGVLRRIGRNREELFDHVVYGLLKEEWQA